MLRRASVLALTLLLAPPASAADDDDELAPLKRPAPTPSKKPPPPRRTTRPAPKPLPSDDDLAPLPQFQGDGALLVRVAGAITGARLAVDAKDLGTLPLGPQAVSAGEHQVTVRRPGFAAWSQRIVVAPNRTVELEAKLAPVAAVLSVTADAVGAQVRIDGRLVGLTPVTGLELPPGVVELTVQRPGAPGSTQRLTLLAGRDYPLTLTLPPPDAPSRPGPERPAGLALVPTSSAEPGPLGVSAPAPATPILERWYVWAGVAAVVAAVAVGTVVGITAAQPPRKRTASEICDGPCAACIGLTCASAGISF